MAKETGTEQRIFEAARAVFQEKGFAGARMHEIAQRAGINASMLHYYFRSKKKLFEAVFFEAVEQVVLHVLGHLEADLPLLAKLERFVHAYIDMIAANPHAPAFILQELRRNPDGLKHMVSGPPKDLFASLAVQLEAAAARGEIRAIAPDHLFANMIALCVFPFLAQPMLQTVFGYDDAAYAAFLAARKQEATTLIFNALAP